MSALKLVPQISNVSDDTLFSLSNLDFHVYKSRHSGWNGIITKCVNGKMTTMCCSSEYKNDVIDWAAERIRD